jgi:hypothetical protein
MNRVQINGQNFDVEGDNVTIISRNGSVIVNGKPLVGGLSGTVDLKIEGAVATVEADGNVSCGDVAGDVDAHGSVTCGNVQGGVDAGGSVTTRGNVGGDVDAGGSVTCGDVAGEVDAGGSVRCTSRG